MPNIMKLFSGKGAEFMKCESDYCIYNRDFSCIIKETLINSLGMCEECIRVSIPDDVLKELKKRQLEEIDSR